MPDSWITLAVESMSRYAYNQNRQKLLESNIDAGPEWADLEEVKKLVWRQWYAAYVHALAADGLAPSQVEIREYGPLVSTRHVTHWGPWE